MIDDAKLDPELSANEIETLLLKAARGGGMPLGAAEDLSRAAPYLDLDAVISCPCSGPDPAIIFVTVGLDMVAAGDGPHTVEGDAAVISALVARHEVVQAKKLVWHLTSTGAVFERFEDGAVVHGVYGRRTCPAALRAHLNELASETLVPETSSSRESGAGAGLTDND